VELYSSQFRKIALDKYLISGRKKLSTVQEIQYDQVLSIEMQLNYKLVNSDFEVNT